MKHSIGGLNKAKLLVALYDNAKESKWTKATLGNMPFLCGQIGLSEEKAQALLDSSSRVDYIGPVLIKIDFSEDEIDTTNYDRDHYRNGGAALAGNVIAELKNAAQGYLQGQEDAIVKDGCLDKGWWEKPALICWRDLRPVVPLEESPSSPDEVCSSSVASM